MMISSLYIWQNSSVKPLGPQFSLWQDFKLQIQFPCEAILIIKLFLASVLKFWVFPVFCVFHVNCPIYRYRVEYKIPHKPFKG